LVKAFAASLSIHFQRIQFTPDLLPADITGSYLFNMRDQTFDLRKGPLFANIVLADEINRAPAKTQSAMLEAMAEQQVTIEGERHPLPPPFMVLATQNPIEQEGVYPLPEAQLDRFLMKFQLGFPPRDIERAMLRTYRKTPESPVAVVDAQTILGWQHDVESVHVTEELEEYLLDLAAYTRNHRSILLGVSPRGTLGLLRAARALAFVRGRDYVIPDDIRSMAVPVMAHRLIIQPEAEMEGLRGEQIIQEALQRIVVLRRDKPA
jgi:MoxR-like ATPase